MRQHAYLLLHGHEEGLGRDPCRGVGPHGRGELLRLEERGFVHDLAAQALEELRVAVAALCKGPEEHADLLGLVLRCLLADLLGGRLVEGAVLDPQLGEGVDGGREAPGPVPGDVVHEVFLCGEGNRRGETG